MGVHRLDRTEARRIAIRAQMLDAARPTDLLAVVNQMTFLQVDPTAVIAPNADLVAWTRLDPSISPYTSPAALESDRSLFELNALIRPITDLRPVSRRDGDLAHPRLQPEMADLQ